MQSILNFSKWKISILIAAMTLVLQPKLAASNSNDLAVLQQVSITGTVTDANTGEALPGVSIAIKGTTTGAITDIDGNYTITANEDDVLIFSYVGYLNEEVVVGSTTVVDIALAVDMVGLDEVVVIGYGTQKKKLNTGATLNMKGEDLEKRNTGDAMSSLQGISPGVNITQNSGAPGAGTKVNIRGIGTVGRSRPLYVVDGVQVDNIDYLAPSDIESIDVLKDGASSAIYGSQAANGVILVTTKRAQKGQAPVITYDTYVGWKDVAQMPDPLNAQDYMKYQDEARANAGFGQQDWSVVVPDYENIVNGSNPGTDWFGEYVNKWAVVQNHSLGIMGSSEKSNYSFGASYFDDEGLLGEFAQPSYKRLTLRLNSEHILKEINGHSLLKFGQNLTYTNSIDPNIGVGDIYDNDSRNMLVAAPIMPVYDPQGGFHYALNFTNAEDNERRYGDDPRYAGLTRAWSDYANPIGLMHNNRKFSENNNNRIVGNAYFELEPIKNLKVRSSFGVNTGWGNGRNYIPAYELSTLSTNNPDIVRQNSYMGYTWIWTNTINYAFNLQEQHNFNIVVGQEAQKTERDFSMNIQNRESTFGDFEHAYLWNVPWTENFSTNYITVAGEDEYGETLPGAPLGRDQYGWAMNSYFGRVSYDFREKYLFTYIIRRDGSSNFAKENWYGKKPFQSFSAGWIVSGEEFMNAVPSISYLKLRGSWGQNGNQDIRPFQDVSSISFISMGYPFGTNKTFTTPGAGLAQLPNPNVTWEVSEQTNVGVDLNFFNNRLQTMFDWYKKTTKDWLVDAPALASYGAAPPSINGGVIVNKGVELMVKWSDRQGDFSYSITGTMAANKNEVTEIANDEEIIHGEINVLTQGMSEIYRAEVGFPIGYFWGYETNGLMRSDEDVITYVNELRANAEAYAAANGTDPIYDSQMRELLLSPGEVRFVDQNGDGIIDAQDKKEIGNPHPAISYGVQIYMDYKNVFMDIVGVGKSGMQVARSWRGYTDRPTDNYSYYIVENAFDLERNPGGTLPRLSSNAEPSRTYFSDIYLQDADYFRISNLTIGYNFKDLLNSSVFKDLKLYVSAQNLLTITKYEGMDPEVGYAPEGWASGVDLGLYPLARTYMVGLNVKF